jgi:hypothetical protein
MPADVSELWTTFVHTAEGPAEVSELWSTFVHSSATEPVEVSELWSTFVHSAEGPGSVSELWTTFVHTVPPITAIISNTPGFGTVGTPFTFIGENSIGLFFDWSIISKPVGSFVGEPVPLPDNGAVTPVDMTDNEGLWHFDGNANDTSGNGRNGTVTGATLVPGYVGTQAYQFGVSDYIDFGAASTFLAAPDDFSISIWIKGDAGWTPVLYDAVLGFSNFFVWSQGVGLYFTNANTLRVFVGAYNGFFTEGTIGTVSDWNHVAITYISGTLRLYINGVEASNNTGGGALTGLTDQLQVGRLGTYGNLEATLDEFAIWSRGLSPTEVADIYALQTVPVTDQPNYTFTPDLNGTYEVQLEVSGYDGGGLSTDTTTGTLFVGAAPPGGGRLVIRSACCKQSHYKL